MIIAWWTSVDDTQKVSFSFSLQFSRLNGFIIIIECFDDSLPVPPDGTTWNKGQEIKVASGNCGKARFSLMNLIRNWENLKTDSRLANKAHVGRENNHIV